MDTTFSTTEKSFVSSFSSKETLSFETDIKRSGGGTGTGENGATFIPSVSAEGVISWTNDKDLPNPDPVNIKGDKGDKGEKGDRGERGLQGIQGERGADGVYRFYDTVSQTFFDSITDTPLDGGNL